MFCFYASTMYHLYMPISKQVYAVVFKFDLIGISVMIFGLTVVSVYLGFHNWPIERFYTLAVMLFFFSANLWM